MIYLPLLIAIIGMIAYILSSNPKASEIGRLAFAVGLLAWLLGGMPKFP